jgi:MFS family permease
VLVLACAGAVVSTVGIQALAPALPVIQEHFELTNAQIGAFVAVYLVPGVLLAFPLGILGDLLGRRTVFSAAASLFAVSGVLGVLTTSFGHLLVLRFFQGIGFAAVMPLTITIIGDVFTGGALVAAQSRRAVSLVLGEFALPVVGTAFAQFGWWYPLLLNGLMLPVAVMALVVLEPTVRRRLRGTRYRTLLGASIRQRGIPVVMALGALRFLFKFSMITYLPLLLVTKFALPLPIAGVVVGLSALCAAVMALLVAAVLRRFRASWVAATALLGIALAFAGLAWSSWWPVAVLAVVLFGAADGVMSVIQDAFVTQRVGADARAGVVALSGTSKNVGKLAAPVLVGSLLVFMSISSALVVLAAVALGGACLLATQRSLDDLSGSIVVEPSTTPIS